ncbi:GNAT family N-acetyltransferase [Synechocystis salina]|uniref:GNAT family N-acetyltransferase n=1 Tax=Synechocystis salina LEGE 00031 TaxID=1828736 RepID=A0ABR9VVP7_9SYNC|nr:GNAT family N-acetyltransferase [Synechocystis salina]MBE9241217.1 GNAT family N-acetyltransferase [Synechocystis salina LEGE 00041]MBE9255116.1 GNAT family N-acetyltransferase [Synechocystis salina LEGE 00031]
MNDYLIRRLTPEDAPGVAALVRRVWGEDYFRRALYDPDALLRANADGRLLSVVGIDSTGRVVAHDALSRPEHESWAETGAAMVDPEHRHHGLMSKTRPFVIQAAREEGLNGVFGHPVADHVFSQNVYVDLGFTCLGVMAGELPSRYLRHVPPEYRSRHGSMLLYALPLRSFTPRRIFPPTQHADLIHSLYARLGIPVTNSGKPMLLQSSARAMRARYDEDFDILVIDRIDSAQEPDACRTDFERATAGHDNVLVQIPLDRETSPDWCAWVEHEGFFFAGITPGFDNGRDVIFYIRLQEAPVPVIYYADPKAEDIIKAVLADCRRATGGAIKSVLVQSDSRSSSH